MTAKRNDLYFQCELGQGTARQVAFIEGRGAHVGKSVELKSDKTFWDVLSVATPGISLDEIRFMQGANWHPSIQG